MPRRIYVYVAGTCAVALAVLCAAVAVPGAPVQWAWWGVALLFACTLVAEAGAVELTRESDQAAHVVSVSTIPHVAAMLLLPPWVAALLAAAGMLFDECRARSPLLRLSFNVACTLTSVGLAGLQAHLLRVAGDHLGNGNWVQVPAVVSVVATYYIVNTLSVAGIGALVGGTSFWRSAAQNVRESAPAMPALALIGSLAAFVWIKDPNWVLVGLIPGAISQLTLRYIAARNRKTEHLAALDRLGRRLSHGLSVEEVFRTASEHLRQVRSVDACFLQLDDPTQLLADRWEGDPAVAATVHELAQRVQSSGQRVWLEDAAAEPRLGGETQTAARSWLMLPLRGESGLTGCLGVAAQAPRAFSSDDIHFLELVAERVGLALEGARRSAELVRMAYHDTLTGLPNRALLLDRLQQALLQRHPQQPAAVLLLDLDNFKVINDSLGHEAGDALLQAVARQLLGAVRAGDTVARLGGDEFVVLLPEVSGGEGVLRMAERLASSLRTPFTLAGREVAISTSIGVALSEPDDREPERLLRAADLALYRAKANGRSCYALFDPEMAATAMERMELESALRGAMERQELQVYYQPIFHLGSHKLLGWEALVRWRHPTRGLVSPALFIPVAEETGLVVALGQWVLEAACRQAQAWQVMTGERGLSMSVNVAARQFQSPDLIADVDRIIRELGVSPQTLQLEITESAIMQGGETATGTLEALKKLGVRLAIDDFGTGYSSLAYLKRFPVDTLKVDRSFVDGLGRDAQDGAIVRSVVALAKALDLNVTAEGIETPAQQAQLALLGCDFGQGYLLGRPVPAEQAEELLLAHYPVAAPSAA
jgi:diguanylate cyclase (GGDEF)-like protein